MKKDRRSFLNQVSLMAGIAALSKPLASAASVTKHLNTLNAASHGITVYHTNDLYGSREGLKQIKNLLNSQETNGLLLDAGDFLSGAHSFDQQKETLYAMNKIGYHAATIGNHELALGQDHLASLVPFMQFSLVNCNYQFNASLSKLVKPYVIIYSGKYKVGITGVGHQLKGIPYTDAIQSANRTAQLLKERENCDLVICLSHLGYAQKDGKPDNQKLAEQSENIDLIVSGHNRKLLRGPMVLRNKLKREVIVSQAAWDGLMLGKTVFGFDDGKRKNNFKAKNFITALPKGADFGQSFSVLQAAEKQRISA